MKRIELFWNILYYCTYALLYKCFRAIDLFRLIDNKYTRKFYKKENIFWQSLDIVKRTEEREKDFSPFILMQAGGGTWIFMIMLILNILNVVMAITHISWYGIMFRDVSNFIISFLLLVLLLYVPNQVFLFKSDKYISYFKQFRKERINKYLKCYFLSYILALIACSFSFILIELTKDRIEYFANNAG